MCPTVSQTQRAPTFSSRCDVKSPSCESPTVRSSTAEIRAAQLPATASGRRWLQAVAALALALALLWFGRYLVLASAGRFLVAEDDLAPADVIIASYADMLADTLEAAHLFNEGVSTRIALPMVASDPVAEEVRRVGGRGWSPTDYAAWLLERSGVPRSAVETLPGLIDGTDSEIAAVAAFAKQHSARSLVYVTARTHTARARKLFRDQLPPFTHLIMRSPRTDPFAPESWWHDRGASREVVMEYLRWVNVFVLGDPWSGGSHDTSSAQSYSP